MDASRIGTRILLIEDDPADADLVAGYLADARRPCHVVTVPDLTQAERRLATDAFDVVLLDLGLPDAQGLDGVVKVRAAEPDVPIVVLTGADDGEWPGLAVSRGAQDFVPLNAANARCLSRTIDHAIQRHRLVKRVHDSEGRLRGLLRAAPIGMGLVRLPASLGDIADAERVVEWVNEGFCAMFGYAEEDIVGRSARFLYESDAEFERVGHTVFGQVAATGLGAVETRFRRSDGVAIDVDVRATLLDPGDPSAGAIFTVLDISGHKRSEAALRKTNRALRTISQCNQVLVRATSEQQLLFDVCRTVVEQGGYRMAWVGFAEEDAARTVRPVAHYGHEKGYLETARVTWNADDEWHCPTGAAICTGAPQHLQNLAQRPEFGRNLPAALERRYAACAALPLKDDRRVFGALSVFAGEPMAFDDAEAELLQEMANDLAYGIQALRESAERRRAEEMVERSKTTLQAILDATEDTIAMLDREGKVIAVNRAGARRFGNDPSDMIGRPLAEFYGDAGAEARRQALDTVLRTKGPLVREFSWCDQIRETTLHPVFDGGDEPVAVTIFSRDITARRRAEDALRKLTYAVEQSPAMVVVTDTDGAIEYVNPRFADITGYAPDDAIGKTPRLLKSGNMPAEVYDDLWRTITGGGTWRGELQNRRKDGTLFWAGAQISPIVAPDGTITHFISVEEDISRKKEAEIRERQADKMEALGALAGGIAHDLNNMLLPVMLLTGEARRALPEDSPSRADLDHVAEVLDRAKDMVARILAFSRKDEPHQEIADLGELVDQSLPFLRSVVPTTIEIDAEIEPGAGPVAVDTTQLHNVLMNLAANAADAMEGTTGRLGLAVAAVDVDATRAERIAGLDEGRYVRVAISDTGHGMDAEILGRAFDPFFTTKDVGKGTGMGLAMVHGIVAKHGGAVDVDSAPGRGTTFHLYFPLAEGNPDDPSPRARRDP